VPPRWSNWNLLFCRASWVKWQWRKPPREKTGGNLTTWPWRSLLALAIALLAQTHLGAGIQPDSHRWTGALRACFGAAGLGVFYAKNGLLRHYWRPASVSDTLQVRWLPLVMAIPLTLAAFLTLNNNLFTRLNVTLWVLAIICVVWGFWLLGESALPLWRRVKAFFTRDTWQIKVTRWTLLVLAVVAVIAFFRIYNLNGVPSEPTSDHAEKIQDVYDVSQGLTHIFFPRNTGREGIQMYLTLVVSWIFGTGLSFLSLKIGTVICGLATLPYMYLLGKEFGGKRIGLLAAFFAGMPTGPISSAGLGCASRSILYSSPQRSIISCAVCGLATATISSFPVCSWVSVCMAILLSELSHSWW